MYQQIAKSVHNTHQFTKTPKYVACNHRKDNVKYEE